MHFSRWLPDHHTQVTAVRTIIRLLIMCLAFAVFGATYPAHGLNPIQVENSLPGTPNWNGFSSDLQQDRISGFGSRISINHGGSIDFYVTTTAPSFTIDVFRTGYYQGIGARLVQSLGSFPGVHQAIPAPDRVTGIIACTNWAKTTTLQVPTTWVSGVYLAKLTTSTGYSSFIFFVVRDDGGTEDLVFQTSVTTYQAYNTWGGTSLYNNLTNMSVYTGPHATKVSFDRPFNPGDSNGAGHYFFYEYKFVYWLESQGYNVAYITNVDTDLGTPPLTNYKGFLSVGHDEYWSLGMRTNVENAINAGVNVAFFSGNEMYWQIRFEPNIAGVPDRVQVGYKDFATDTTPPGPDPEWGVNNAIVTTNWRDPTVNQPENAVSGVMFEDQTDNSYAYVVQNADFWIYDNTGFVNGSSVPGIVGYEYDKVWDNGFSPPGLTVLSNSPVHTCCENEFNSFANSTIYTAPSQARVFAAGTIQWSWGLANVLGNTFADARIQQTTANILNNFIFGPSPNAAFSSASLNFNGNVVGTTSATGSVVLTNTGTATLDINSITVTGVNAGDFAQANNCPATLAINQSCTINAVLVPSAAGNRSASLTVSDNASNSPQNIELTGIGQVSAAPLVSLNPTILTFGYQNVGTTSVAQTVTLTNVGTAPLGISSITSTGADPSDFIPTNTCPVGPNTLPVNGSCSISVVFSPTLPGARTANVTFTDNAADSPESISLTGSAITPIIYFSDGFESGDFSNWNLSSSDSTGQRTVETAVVNNGLYAAAFTITNGQYDYIYTALPGGSQSQTFTRFYFRLTNVSNATILAQARNANGGNTWEVDYNAGRNGLDFYFWNSSGAVYSIFSPNQLITANTWYCLEIQDTQTTTGQAQAWLNGTSVGVVNADLSNANPFARLMLYDGAAGTTYFDDVVVANVYNGLALPAPAITLNSSSLNFGSQSIGSTSSPQTITLANKGTAPLNFSSFSIVGPNAAAFTFSGDDSECPHTLPVSATCALALTFSPTTLGNASASIVITDNDPSSPQIVSLSGTGVSPFPAVTLNPGSLTFGNQSIGTTGTPQTITLTSSGGTPLSISSITVTGTNAGDFAESDNCPIGSNTLATNASCTISITFSPTANGTRTASVTVTDNAPDSPQSISVAGSGMTPTIYFSDGFESGDFSNWNLGSSDSTGQRSVQTAVVNSGTYAAAFTITNGQYDYIYAALPGGPQSQTFTRFYFRLTNASNATILAQARNANGGNTWEVDYNAGRNGLDFYFWNSSGAAYSIFSPNQVIAANTWYCLEIQDTQTTTGQVQAWLNGTSVGFVNADLSNANPLARLILYDAAVGTMYFDDVVVANVYNGPTLPAPALQMHPSSLNFGSQTVGTTSTPRTITLTSTGAVPLSISSITLTGTSPGDFAETDNCPIGSNTLAVNASCTITITFSPTANGTRTASVTVTDSAAGSPQSVALNGTGGSATPIIYFSDGFESGDFSNWNLGSSDSTGQRSVQTAVVNSGTYAAAFTITSGQYDYIYTALPGGPQSQTFTRFYFQLANVSNGTILAQARNANGGNTWEVDYNAGRNGLDFYFWNSSGGVYSIFSANQVIAANTWYSVEIQDTQTTTGQAQAWVNGTSVGVVNADLSNANPVARLLLYDAAVGTIYFDDVVVANVPF
jgi:hypothetical protein